MSTGSYTLAAMIEDASDEYKRPRPDIIARLPERLNWELSQLATEYPFWLLVIEPGLMAPGLFPFGQPPVYNYLAEGTWIDVGWFTSIQGQQNYYLSTPADFTMPLTSPWSRYRAQTISTLYEWRTYGGPPREIQILEQNEFLRLCYFEQNQGRPTHAMLYQANDQSVLRFNRIPDGNEYIYSTRIVRKDWPAFQSPSDTNPIFRYQPKIVRTILCREIAKMFRDYDAAKEYDNELKGYWDPATGKRVPGLYDKLKQETRKQYQPEDQVQEGYTAPPFGQGSRGVRTQSGHGWYDDGYGYGGY